MLEFSRLASQLISRQRLLLSEITNRLFDFALFLFPLFSLLWTALEVLKVIVLVFQILPLFSRQMYLPQVDRQLHIMSS